MKKEAAHAAGDLCEAARAGGGPQPGNGEYVPEIAIEPEFVVRESTGPASSRIQRSAEQRKISLQAGASPSD
jgi:hypothetical protein